MSRDGPKFTALFQCIAQLSVILSKPSTNMRCAVLTMLREIFADISLILPATGPSAPFLRLWAHHLSFLQPACRDGTVNEAIRMIETQFHQVHESPRSPGRFRRKADDKSDDRLKLGRTAAALDLVDVLFAVWPRHR